MATSPLVEILPTAGRAAVRVPSISVFPQDDAAFVSYVRRALEPDPPASPEALAERIHGWYPRARVVERLELAGFGHPHWYVYRDGQALSEHGGAWWENPDTPRVTFDSLGFGHDPSPEFCALFRVDARDIEGRPWSSLLPGEAARHDTSWISETLRRDGRVTTTAEVRRGDGTTAWIEFHVRPTDGARFLAFCRELQPAAEQETRAPAAR